MIKFIKKEISAFKILDSNAQRLIATNLIYAIAFPFIIIFGTAFILRATDGDKNMAMYYNWMFFIGLTFGYFLNGMILKNKILSIKTSFSMGMMLTVIPLYILMTFITSKSYNVIIYGLLIGIGNGIYWSCRNFLTFLLTNDSNRNYYMSIEQFIIIFCNALIPLIFGTLILGNTSDEAAKFGTYKYAAGFVILTNIVACILIYKSNFFSPEIKKFTYATFNKKWNIQRLLTFSVGTVESGFMVLMTVLILTVAGDESVLGKFEFFSALFSVIVIYIVGRIAKEKHRSLIMFTGAAILIIGSINLMIHINNQNTTFLMISYSFLSVIGMKISQVIADPLIHSSFRATLLKSCDNAIIAEKKDSYSYIMDNEYFMNGGRIFGGMVFIGLNYLISDISGLKYTFLILAFIQLLSAYLIFKINKNK